MPAPGAENGEYAADHNVAPARMREPDGDERHAEAD